MKHVFTALGLGVALAACAPRVLTQATHAAHPVVAATGPAGFLVIKETETFTGPTEELGDIQI